MIDKVEDLTTSELIATLLRDLYTESSPPPKEVLVEVLPPDVEPLGRRVVSAEGVSRIGSCSAARRQTAIDEDCPNQRQGGVCPASSQAPVRSQRPCPRICGAWPRRWISPNRPSRIEAYDISTIQGRHTVSSMVVLEDGMPRRGHYRRFKIRTVEGQDDFSSMEETIRRRFTAYVKDMEKPPSERGKFSYPPSLVLIDGGPGQLGRAVKVLSELDLDIPVVGLAKRMEEVYVPGQPDPIRNSEGSTGAPPPPAGEGRGASFRNRLPPPVTGQANDRLDTRRCRRHRAETQTGVDQGHSVPSSKSGPPTSVD